jgi:hypothetical protein
MPTLTSHPRRATQSSMAPTIADAAGTPLRRLNHSMSLGDCLGARLARRPDPPTLNTTPGGPT